MLVVVTLRLATGADNVVAVVVDDAFADRLEVCSAEAVGSLVDVVVMASAMLGHYYCTATVKRAANVDRMQ